MPFHNDHMCDFLFLIQMCLAPTSIKMYNIKVWWAAMTMYQFQICVILLYVMGDDQRVPTWHMCEFLFLQACDSGWWLLGLLY